ncbi:unnamed protein product [Trichobilharzia szidati]|nr:unnamed protein product [Trichobilharzia szidati]
MENPSNVTQEALSMLEAYLNISSTKRCQKFKSSDLKAVEPRFFLKTLHNLPVERDVEKDVPQVNLEKIDRFDQHEDKRFDIPADTKQCETMKKLSQNESQPKCTSANLNEVCLPSNKKNGHEYPLFNLNNGSLPLATQNSGFSPPFDTAVDLGSDNLQPDSLYGSSSIELVSSPPSEDSSRVASHTRNESSLVSKTLAVKKASVTSSIVRYHSVSSGGAQRSHIIPKTEEWAALEVNCQQNHYTRRCSVRSAPEDMHHCVRMKPKRSAPKKWFKFRLPKSGFAIKPHAEKKLLSDQGESADSRAASGCTNSIEVTSSLENREVTDHDGDSISCLTSRIYHKKPDMISKATDSFHHPPFINVFAQLFPRLFRQEESSTSYVSSGFFLRMQRLSTTTTRRVKRHKRRTRKLDKLSNQVSVDEHEEKFHLLPLYTKRRSSELSDQENKEKKDVFTVRQLESTTTNIPNDLSKTMPTQNELCSSPTMNSKTWPVCSPNSKMATEVARLYQGLIETIEGGKLIESTFHTWGHFSIGKPQCYSKDYLPFFSHSSPVKYTKSNKTLHYTTSKNLTTTTGKDVNGYSKSTDQIHLSNSETRKETMNTTDSTECKSSVNNELSPNDATKHPGNCSKESFQIENDKEKVDCHANTSTNGNTQYPYAKYVAAMIDALSERLMGKISEDDLELRFRTLEAEATEAAKRNTQSVKRERFLSVSNEAEILCCKNSVQNTCDCSSPEESISTKKEETQPLTNKRCFSISNVNGISELSDSPHLSPLEESQRSLKHCCLAQVKRLQQRNKLVITVDLLKRLVNHTNYPNFEADILELLGRQPSWHHIAILYYLTRRLVKHIMALHIRKLELIQGTSASSNSSALQHPALINSDSDETEDYNFQLNGSCSLPRGSSELYQGGIDPLNPMYDTIVTEIGRCRANVGRIKDYTITFFTRWYADWVYKHGGWQSVIDDTEDSEID